jgi:tetratricopeptide (TPR) repeat protein
MEASMTGFDIWNELGNIYFKVGAFDEAIDAYNKAIELDFRIGWLYSNLGFAYAHKGKFAEAIPVYEKSIELLNSNEDKAVSWGRLAEAYQQLDRYDDALLAYQKAVELNPQDTLFSAGLSTVQRQMGQLDQDALAQAIQSEYPEDSSILEDVFLDDIEQEHNLPALDDAKNDLVVAGAVSRLFEEETIPASVSSTNDLIPADYVNNSEELQEEIIPMVMEIVGDTPSPDPDLPDHTPDEMKVPEVTLEETNPVPEMIIDPLIESGQYDDTGSEIVSPAVVLEQDELNITTVNALLTCGIELWRKGDHEKAGETLQTALEAARKAENKWLEALSHNAMALVKTELGKLEEAIGSYIQAMQLAPEKIIPWNNIGHLYSRLDRNDEAMEAFLKAIEHNPEDFVSWDGLGDIYAKSGRLNDSIAAYQLGNVFGKHTRTEDVLTAYQMIIEPDAESISEKPADVVWIPEIPETIEPDMNEELALAHNALVTAETRTETVAINVNDAAHELAEVVLTDEVSTGATNEIPPSIDQSYALDEISTMTDEIQMQDVVAVENISAIPETVNEVVSTENLPASGEPVKSEDGTVRENPGEMVPVSSKIDAPAILEANDISADTDQPDGESIQVEDLVAVHMLDELASPENIVSLPSDWRQPEDVVHVQPMEEVQNLIAELAEEIVLAEDHSASSIQKTESNEIAVRVQTEQELLADASSSIELSRLTSAIAAYKKVTEINPENDRAWDSLGNLYRASERYSDAASAFEQAISLRPNKEVYYYHLGLVYAAEKHYENAIQAFQKVIELNPEYTFAHCALAGYFRKLGMENEAQEHIEKALPKMTSEKEYDRACFSAICGNTDEAIELLKIALEKKQTSLDWVRRDPDLDFIRDDQRFKALLSQNGNWSERVSEIFSRQLAWSPNK